MLFMAQPGTATMSCGSWDSASEGAQNFASFSNQGDLASDSEYTYAPYSQEGLQPAKDHMDSLGSYQQQHNARTGAAMVPMQRTISQASGGSYKSRTIRASSHKSRPRIRTEGGVAAAAAAAPGAPPMEMSLSASSAALSAATSASAGSYGDVYFSANGVLPSTMSSSMAGPIPYYQDMDMPQPSLPLYQPGLVSPASFGSELAYSPDFSGIALGPSVVPPSQHVDPACTQMHMDNTMDFEVGLPAISPNSLASVSSRLSSPDPRREDDVWSTSQPLASSPAESHGSTTSFAPLQASSGATTSDDTLTGDYAMPAAFHRSNSENDSARDSPLYKDAVVQADGLYHCPFEGDASCNHRPEKLKCNYDKFVDSHLKPYRCKNAACENARFSSTACLLRHEREAHAMHGHGDKPFRCTYEGCDRSQPGNGFPRQWNLRDHMRRVHHDSGIPATTAPVSTAVYAASSSHSASTSQTITKGRKRKKESSVSSHGSSSTTGSSSRKPSSASSKAHHGSGSASKAQQAASESKASRAAAAAAAASKAASKAALQKQAYYNDFFQHKKALSDLVSGFAMPDDPQMDQQLLDAQMHISAIRRISTDMTSPQNVEVFQDPYLQAFNKQSG